MNKEEHFLSNLVLVVDSREQQPYLFDNHKTIVKGLNVGDYSLLSCEDQVSIERKSVDDLIGSLTSDRDRFEKELNKGRFYQYFALVIEASLNDLTNGRYRSAMLPKSAVQSLMSFSVKYRLPVFFAGSRVYAEKVTLSLQLKYGRMIYQQYGSLMKDLMDNRVLSKE